MQEWCFKELRKNLLENLKFKLFIIFKEKSLNEQLREITKL